MPATGGPLLDWSGLLLGLVALAAVAGLIPLWMAVALQSDQATGSATPPAPGAVATVTPGAGQQGLAPGVDMGATVSMPNTVGQSMDDARRLLESQQLGVTTDLTTTHSAPTGQVVAQFPAAGAAVPAGTVARLVVSGQTLVTVPPLSGDYTSVAAQLERAGLVPRAVEQWGGSESPVGAVLGFDPPPGMRVAGGTVVSVLVNSGTWLPLGVDFADHIHLPGVALARDVVKPGDGLDVELRWEAVEPVTGDYVARVLLADAGGQAVAVVDRTPGGDRPTNTWQAGEVFASDHFPLVVPAELAPGRYTLALELANRADPTQRLEVLRSAFARTDGPRVVIRPLTVAAP
jgi:hypothetical protein